MQITDEKRALFAKLPVAGKSRLQALQRLWITWRDAEFKLVG